MFIETPCTFEYQRSMVSNQFLCMKGQFAVSSKKKVPEYFILYSDIIVQGDPQIMRLQRRLYGVYTGRFFIHYSLRFVYL